MKLPATKPSRRGSAVASALMAASVLIILLFTMAEAATFHLQLANSADNRAQAGDLAESVVNQALAEALLDDKYGITDPTKTIRIDGQGDASRNYGLLSFDRSNSSVPYSLNSLAVTSQVQGSTGHAVPANTIHLVGQGHVGDQVRTVEAIYYRPPFPKALSATGPIHATGTVVTGIKPDATYAGNPGSIPSTQRLPGSLQSNSNLTGSQNALELSDCNISGDVAAVGQVLVGANNTIGGEVRSNGDPQPIPHVDIQTLIASVQGADGTEILSGSVGDKKVNFFAGCPIGDLTVAGDLELNNGVLWVKGDLTVTGGIKGQGLLLATGKVEVRKGTQLNAQNLVAVACAGDAVFKGQGQDSYYFQGLVYTKGNFLARDLTVLGTVIADSNDPTKGGLELQNVNFIQSSTAADYRVSQPLHANYFDGKGGGGPPANVTASNPAKIPPPTKVNPPVEISMTAEPVSYSKLAPADRTQIGKLTFDFSIAYAGKTLSYTGSSDQITAFIRYLSNNKPDINLQAMGGNPPPPEANKHWLDGIENDNHNNDVTQQVDIQRDIVAANNTTAQLMQSINNLMPPGQQSRMLLYRSY